MSARVTNWPGASTPGENELRQLMAEEGLRPYSWSNGPGDVYTAHSHDYDKVIYVLRGSITFQLPDSASAVYLEAGDRLDLDRGTGHSATVGPAGVVCLEAHN